MFIGLDDQKAEGTFSWIDSTPVTFTYWAPNEPNNHKGQEDCTEVNCAITATLLYSSMVTLCSNNIHSYVFELHFRDNPLFKG